MRTTLLPGMLDVASRNINRHTGQGRFFEVGNVHIDAGNMLPEEQLTVGLLFFGGDDSFYSLKGAITQLFDRLHIPEAAYARTEAPYLQPGRAAVITGANGESFGWIGEVHPDVTANWKISDRIYAAELRFDALYAAANAHIRFVPLPRFPVVQRDLAVVVDLSAESAALRTLIETTDTPLIIGDVQLFDSYAGVGVLPGKKNLAFTFTLRAEDHTLSDEEIKTAMQQIIEKLRENGALLRG